MFKKLCLCLVLGLFILNPIKSLSQPTDCLDMFVYDPANNCTFVQTVTKTIYYPQYNNCSVEFTYRVYECEEATLQPNCDEKKKYNVFQITRFNPDWGCDEIMEAIFPGFQNDDFSNPNEAVMTELMLEGEKQISEELFLDYYNTLDPTEQEEMMCGGTYPNCDSPPLSCNKYSVFYTQPSCYKYCLSINNILGIPILYVYIVRCVEQSFACCVTERIYCICDDDDDPLTPPIVNSSSITVPIPGGCLENTTSCPVTTGGLNIESDCIQFCPTD